MPSRRVIHLSRAKDASDGGVATAVSELIRHQNILTSVDANWHTSSEYWSLDPIIRSSCPHVLHVHGLWSSPNRAASRLHDSYPVVVAPHGMLDPWAFAHHRRRKRLLWWLYESRLLQHASAIHALCQSELRSIRSLNITSPIALIPNGVELPSPSSSLPDPVWSDVIPSGSPVLLFLGRFHEKKGIQPLIEAWRSMQPDVRDSGWWLAFVGYGDNGQLRSQLSEHPLAQTVVCDAVFDQLKQATLSSASAFILPSFSEGLPMAALEAMAYRLPCLLSDACNIPDAFTVGAAMRSDPDPASLAIALRHLFSLNPNQRAQMGSAAFNLVSSRYSWSRVVHQTVELYDWIIDEGPMPPFVSLA